MYPTTPFASATSKQAQRQAIEALPLSGGHAKLRHLLFLHFRMENNSLRTDMATAPPAFLAKKKDKRSESYPVL